jgi:hypothetical protein
MRATALTYVATGYALSERAVSIEDFEIPL